MVQQPLYSRPEWHAAHSRVLALLPTAKDRITSPAELDPDKICDAATAAQLNYDFVLLPNPGRQSHDHIVKEYFRSRARNFDSNPYYSGQPRSSRSGAGDDT